jgi:hypothetical protein
MEGAGLPATHVKGIRGFADTILRTPTEPFNPRNRRVSIVVQNHVVPQAARTAADGPAPEHATHGEAAEPHAAAPAPKAP